MPDLVVPVPVIVNSELAKKHATPQDPWAFEWVARNDCGGGAYKVESWSPGQPDCFHPVRRLEVRPLAPTQARRLSADRLGRHASCAAGKGDVDMSVGLPPKDYAELAEQGKVTIIGVPVQNDLVFIDRM